MDENNQEMTAAEVQSQGGETTAESQAEVIERQAFEDQKARAEKAEAKLKELKAALAEKQEKSEEKVEKAQPTLTTEEIRLIAKFDDDGLDRIRKIATVEGVSLAEAAKSDLFQAWLEKREREQKAQQAQLRASRGAGSSEKPLTFAEAGKDPETHKKMLKAYLYGK